MHAHADHQRVTLPDVLISPELARRTCRPPDFAAENRALVALAREMPARPENLPQKLTDLALELCRAGSAGIADGEPLATIWVVAHDEQRRFDAEDARLLQSLGASTGAALRTLASLDAEKRAHEEQTQANAALEQEMDWRHRSEAALSISEARYRTLFESIDEGFCVIEMLFDDNGKSVDYRFLEINPAFEKQTGLKQVVNKTMRELAPKHEGALVRHLRQRGFDRPIRSL